MMGMNYRPQMHPQMRQPALSAQAQAKRSSWSPSVSSDTKENQAGAVPVKGQTHLLFWLAARAVRTQSSPFMCDALWPCS